ncbi:MAG: stage II sporulation protein M [Vicinamibacteria bacterium]|jgi:uncharacterized membrane protein SpoIIM required for sporulation|nr:stage II sporulation protein M [Vicinamibacteria bacterium]
MIDRFIQERRNRWARLTRLLDEVERLPEHEIGPDRVSELVTLYRQTCSDLNEARSLTANEDVLARLNDLAGRGYRFIYRRQPGRLIGAAMRRFLRIEAPLAFRRERFFVTLASLTFLIGAVIGATAVFIDRDNGERLIPRAFFTESPRERVERIEAQDERIDSLEEAGEFGSYLFQHNIRVAFLAFSLGAVSFVGGLWILLTNGITLGAVAALYVLDGVQVFFLAWVGPHGSLELPAIVFAGAAGLRAGRALLAPGQLSTGSALRAAFPQIARMLITVVLILVAAGIIEGSFSQFSAKTFPYSLKIGVAATLFASLLVYLFLRRIDETGGAE